MSIHPSRHDVRLVVLVGLALAVIACSHGDGNKNPVHSLFNGAGREAENGLFLTADPPRILIDPSDPNTPTDPAHGNKRYDETALLVVATDPTGAPQPNLDVTFGATAGVLASAGAVVKTDAAGHAGDSLRVFEDSPDSIQVSVTDGSRITTLAVTKIVVEPPVANAGPDQVVECTGNSSATVKLDGSGSTDPNGDIALYEWFENFGTSTQALLGSGRVLDVVLHVGTHAITLRVTDATGKTSTDDVVIRVVDTTPPRVEVIVSPSRLWPPNHRMLDIHADLRVDECGPFTVNLESVTSNEPDNGLGDGDTAGDVQGVLAGTPDVDFAVRAERAGGGSGRVYTVVYRVTDAVGLATIATASVTVPHDQSGR
ncbi:MAG: PKD domain-containing protein [Acidobacteriia bacterium]|nr:PKD domain-containing protein [Terriglobia bacterium]